MTITLTPQTETRLCEKAERDGQDINMVAAAIITARLEWEARESEETVAGIQRGLQAAAEGRERPFNDYVADVKASRSVKTRMSVQEA